MSRSVPLANRIQRLIVFSPDGRLLAAPCSDETENADRRWVSVWEVASGWECFRIDQLPAHVDQLVFSPDAKQLATSHTDTTILIWDLDQFRVDK